MTAKELYEYFEREVDRDDYIDYIIDNGEIDVNEDMIDAYRKYLKLNNMHELYDDIDDIFNGYTVREALESIDFSNFDIDDDYYRFDDYNNVESVCEWFLIYEMEGDEDFLRWYIDEYDYIDDEEMNSILDDANKIAEEEEGK